MPPQAQSPSALWASLTTLMQTKSKTDYTLFFCNLFRFGLLALTFSIPFWKTSYFEKVSAGSTKHILLGLGYILVFVFLPLFVLSWSITTFVVERAQITVVDWFGLRSRTFSLPHSSGLTVKRETAPYQFRFFPLNSKYNEFKTLYIETLEGKKLRIQSRYIKNFGQFNIAVRKASTSQGFANIPADT